MSSFDALDDQSESVLLAAAAAATTHAVDDRTVGPLVIVVHPTTDDRQVLAGGGNSVLRASVSVVAGSENPRLWADAPTGSTTTVALRDLPEVLRTAADATGTNVLHVGRVEAAGELAAVAVWFETADGVADAEARHATLEMLGVAARRDRERRAAEPVAIKVVEQPQRRYAENDPTVDPATGVLNRGGFEEAVDAHDTEEATLLLIDLDDFDAVEGQMGADIAAGVCRTIADRLCDSTRRNDAIAHLGDAQFAVLFGDIQRNDAMHVAKRLLNLIAEPMTVDGIDVAVTATVAFAHQIGLVDIEEMMESAEHAVASGKRSGPGRLILAV